MCTSLLPPELALRMHVGRPAISELGGNFMVVERGEFFSELERLTEKVRRAWTYGTRNSSHSYRST